MFSGFIYFYNGLLKVLLSDASVLHSEAFFPPLKHFLQTGLYDYSPPISSISSEAMTL
jgi:hypothetical protein